MTRNYIQRQLRHSLRTYRLFHWVSGCYFLAFALSLLAFFSLVGQLIIQALTFWGSGTIWEPGWPATFALIFLTFLASLAFDPIYSALAKKWRSNISPDLDDTKILYNAIHFYFPGTGWKALSWIPGMIALPSVLIKAGCRALADAVITQFFSTRNMTETIHLLRGWRQGIPHDQFLESHGNRKVKNGLKNLIKLNLVSIALDEYQTLFLNRSILTLWASGRIFIFPLSPVIEAFTSIFITLNNFSRSKHWKVRVELITTILVRFSFSAVITGAVLGFLYLVLPDFSGKTGILVSSGLLVCGIFTALPHDISLSFEE